MLFTIQIQGKTHSYFDCVSYEEALCRFKEINVADSILRDYQNYVVNEDSWQNCKALASIDFLRTQNERKA